MKFLKSIVALIAIAIFAIPASAQFKVGPRLGVNVNSLHFNGDIFKSDNRAGFTGGVMAEFTVPIIGIGLDASVMYVRRDAKWVENNLSESAKRDYVSIPVNIKYKLNLPAVNHLVRPYLATGPEFSFLTSRRAINNAFRNKSTDVSWNIGVGVELISHLQISATYGLGLNKNLVSLLPIDLNSNNSVEGKNRYWTITAAWLF